MLTPLFPENDALLDYQQGKTGDCFLLVALECIYNSGTQGRKFLKSMFEQKKDNIWVRLPHTAQSIYLQPDKFKEKYNYYLDIRANKDIFIISKSTLEAIDDESDGVVSNSLAIKILERIISHYYEFPWDRRVRRGSLYAHNFEGSRHPNSDSSSIFLSKILGVEIESFDIEQIIRLKHICPGQPVYVGMKKNSTGIANDSRHAYLLQGVFPSKHSPGEYDFNLVNPWNNTKTEICSMSEIKSKNSRFVIFIIDLELHTELKYVLENSQLFDLICQAKRHYPLFTGCDFVRKFSKLYREMSYLPDILRNLTPDSLRMVYLNISIVLKTKQDLVELLLSRFSYVWLAETIIFNEPLCSHTVNRYLAGVALRATHSRIYNYLVERKFDFNLFISTHPGEINIFFRNIVELEKSNVMGGISTFRRIHSYIHTMNLHKIHSRTQCPPMRGSVIHPITEHALKQFKIDQIELIVSDCVEQIQLLPVTFGECGSITAALYHRDYLFRQLNNMIKNAGEAYQTLESKIGEHHPQITDAIRIKKLTIDEAETARIKILRSSAREPYPHTLFKKTCDDSLPLSKSTLFPTTIKASLC